MHLKDFFDRPLPRRSGSHATLLALVGAYLIYMAYEMVRDTLSGASEMPMQTTVILAGIMGLCGLGVIGYGVFLWRAAAKAKAQEPDETDQEEKTDHT